ncbi:class I SAM-dependent methyltransferase [Sporanaerobacter acetigenes]|uniref:Ubiquinone/menaquinone biosynthesis C-methylase UbiE n=1 Tax=Sporanaerobacter acetigenes DSM 13106 TaxID=1123281 RepID=A0A1M5Z4V5_9FIRM|nr:methyltransferase domain-containing protein [Sporanaerobacter acetigenes]SHI19138.1 Ubiquinone/menaquinone biosynthesis C-methylase UbiE [Sporanaerobacter acetigenes DSM 13106]
MENNIWSENIQGILMLDLSREMRFRDDRKDLFLNILGLKEGMTVLDIGCGPGAITRKLSSWLGNKSKIIGIDRDTTFINYAKEKARKQNIYNISYIEGDALKLPLEDNSVDACISHTVIEHVPNKEFLLEQKRVCRPEGRVSVMYARPDKYIKTEPEFLPKQSEREMELLDKLFKETDDVFKKYNVAKYAVDPVELPELFEKLGFKEIQVDGIAIPIATDDARNSYNEKVAIVEVQKKQLLEVISMGLHQNKNGLSDEEEKELKQLIVERFDKRVKLLEEDKNIWDYTIALLQIVSGMVV